MLQVSPFLKVFTHFSLNFEGQLQILACVFYIHSMWIESMCYMCACKYPFELFILLATKSALVGFVLIAIDALVSKNFPLSYSFFYLKSREID